MANYSKILLATVALFFICDFVSAGVVRQKDFDLSSLPIDLGGLQSVLDRTSSDLRPCSNDDGQGRKPVCQILKSTRDDDPKERKSAPRRNGSPVSSDRFGGKLLGPDISEKAAGYTKQFGQLFEILGEPDGMQKALEIFQELGYLDDLGLGGGKPKKGNTNRNKDNSRDSRRANRRRN